MAGPVKRGRKRKEVLIQESLQAAAGGGGGGLHQMQLDDPFLPSFPPHQDTVILPAKHRYPTRGSSAVPHECPSSTASLTFPLRHQIGTPKQSYVTAKRVLLEANNTLYPAGGDVKPLEKCSSELPHQIQVSTFPATSLSHSSTSAEIGKSMKNAGSSASTKEWSAPISSGDRLDVEKFTANLLWQTERPENFLPLVPLINERNSTEKNLHMTGANLGSNAIHEVPEKIATSSHTKKNSQLSRCPSFNLSEMAHMSNDDFHDDEEVESAIDPALVTVHQYRVNQEVAPLLRAIFAKYGDIAKNTILESPKTRRIFLEMVCGIYQKLENSGILDISSFELNTLLRLIHDLECMKLDVKWLHQKIDEISYAKHILGDYFSLKKERTRNFELIARKEEELGVLQKKIFSEKVELEAMKNKAEEIDKKVVDLKEKASGFCRKSLVHGLL
ncbi:uncharacterized protein LOC113778753 [Coffea eugenioides]|uniref:uncharacterized protein LOC113778753 n=1 Tax=Coffea eugenioides TaxID=49369 RepID=UPI000F6130B5|nr:uncharacterized protein LOC113778753 [Coffea eugenioides]